MKAFSHLFAVALISLLPSSGFCQPSTEHVVYDGKSLTQGYDMGVDSSGRMHNWLRDAGNELVMTYPSGQSWGAVFVTVGKPRPSPGERQSKNFLHFSTLIISMKGATGSEQIQIGIKDKTDPDDGSETKRTVALRNTYSEYSFPLRDFATADLQNLYVVTEFVFGSVSPCKVFVNSIKFR
jgi:hypothetical protein